MPPSLSELKVLPSFCFAFKIPDDVAASSTYLYYTYLYTSIYTKANTIEIKMIDGWMRDLLIQNMIKNCNNKADVLAIKHLGKKLIKYTFKI